MSFRDINNTGAGIPSFIPTTPFLVVFGLLILVVLVLLVRRQGALAALFGSSIDASIRLLVVLNVQR